MSKEEIDKKYADLREELMRERGISAMGGAPPSPGKIESLRRQIARIETVMRESER
ncbi:MAG: 50S ribosomal protein L29 [Candidatus Thermoplasmatota archaeon]|jgi:large subunit ribosomal protein L29|nr:50S ribosomal protein L29 [Candidatus Thermoplasmatota archaeon]MCL5790239.1 50S ribosomal protein L29 [Candidatus Thermoplasmatota archaeon]